MQKGHQLTFTKLGRKQIDYHRQFWRIYFPIAEPSNWSADYVLENRWETLQ